MADKTLSVLLRNRTKVLFEGGAMAVTSYNEKGIFDILPQHMNLITLIKDKIIIHKDGEQKEEYALDSGILDVSENHVWVYLGLIKTV